MTWVVGANTGFGYGMVISDTCVSFPDGRTADIVQKAYPVGHDMVAGFSGNIKNGFILLDDLRRSLRVEEADMAWDPQAIAEQWPSRARIHYNENPEFVRGESEATSILMVGIYPEKKNAFGYPMSMGAVFRSPEFEPKFYFELNDLFSIGSGCDVEKYLSLLCDIQKDWVKFLNMGPGGYGAVVRGIIGQTMFKYRAEGISAHTHTLFVTQGAFELHKSDHEEFLGTGEVVAVHRMPEVATSWGDLIRMIGDSETTNRAIG